MFEYFGSVFVSVVHLLLSVGLHSYAHLWHFAKVRSTNVLNNNINNNNNMRTLPLYSMASSMVTFPLRIEVHQQRIRTPHLIYGLTIILAVL